MAYVTVPKDLTKVKSKVMFNLTKRQLICFTPAVLLGVPLFFLSRGVLGNSTATLLMILVMLPFFFFAMYEKNGMPLEVYLKHMINTKFIKQAVRPYQTTNFYCVLAKQRKLEKEVRAIVNPEKGKARKAKKAHKKAEKGNQ